MWPGSQILLFSSTFQTRFLQIPQRLLDWHSASVAPGAPRPSPLMLLFCSLLMNHLQMLQKLLRFHSFNLNLLERNPAFPGNLAVCFLRWIGRGQNRMEFCSCWTAESRLVLPTLRKQKQGNAVEKRGAELDGMSAR